MSGGDDEKGSANGVFPDSPSSDPGPIPLDDPRVTPLGGNAGVHIRSDDEEKADEVAIDFGGFIISLGTSCMINLGKHEDPHTGTINRDLDAARQVIHILEMLREKTAGNLCVEEENLLKTLLADLRQAYGEAAE